MPNSYTFTRDSVPLGTPDGGVAPVATASVLHGGFRGVAIPLPRASSRRLLVTITPGTTTRSSGPTGPRQRPMWVLYIFRRG